MALSCLGLWAGCAAIAPGEAAATPKRPTFSSNIATTAHQTVEVEAGVLHDPGDLHEIQGTVKYGLSEDVEVFADWSPQVWIRRTGPNAQGRGDVLLGIRHRFLDKVGSRPGAALRLAAKLPTASQTQGIGTGRMDFFTAGAVEWDIEEVTLLGYYELGFLGQEAPRDVDASHAIAVAAETSLSRDLNLKGFGELAHLIVPEQDVSSVFATLGIAHSVSPALVLDAAIRVGLSSDAPDFQVLAGITYNLGSPLFRFAGVGRGDHMGG